MQIMATGVERFIRKIRYLYQNSVLEGIIMNNLGNRYYFIFKMR